MSETRNEPSSSAATAMTPECPPVQPQREHEWLHRMVGQWTYEAECVMGPDQPASTVSGAESVRSIGGVWVMSEWQGDMPPGNPATMILTLGYDPQRQQFVGTFIASMMTHLWIYHQGELDAAENTLTLHAEGPNMTEPGKMANYKDVIQLRSDDHRVMTSFVQGEDGQWHQIMCANYRRK